MVIVVCKHCDSAADGLQLTVNVGYLLEPGWPLALSGHLGLKMEWLVQPLLRSSCVQVSPGSSLLPRGTDKMEERRQKRYFS